VNCARPELPAICRRRIHDLLVKRLLRLSLFLAPAGMALVLVLGTLKRVMVVELGCPFGGRR
jgi:hypothetical protein